MPHFLKQSGTGSVTGFAEYYKDVIQDDTYAINKLHDDDESVDEYV